MQEIFDYGVEQFQLGNYPRALSNFQKILNQYPEEVEVLIFCAACRYYLDDEEGAAHSIEQAIQLDSENTEALYWKAKILLRRQDFDNAQPVLEKLHHLSPQALDYLELMLSAYTGMYLPDKISEICDQILAIDPDHATAAYTKASMLLEKGEPEAAATNYKNLIGKYPEDVNLLNGLALSLIRQDKTSEALEWLNKASEKDPYHPFVRNNKGYALYKLGMLKESLKETTLAIKLDPENPAAYKNRALAWMELEEPDKAYNDLLRAQELGFTELYGDEVDRLLEKWEEEE